MKTAFATDLHPMGKGLARIIYCDAAATGAVKPVLTIAA